MRTDNWKSYMYLAVAGTGLLLACMPCSFDSSACVHECSTSRDCPSGQVCVHEHAHDLDLDTCENPCTYTDAGMASFRCLDSPLGTACRTDDGTPFCPPKI